MTERFFSDEDLTAFMDGEADAALEAAISDALETDAALAERIAGLDVPLEALRAGYAALLEDIPPMPALPQAAPPQRRFGGLIAGGGLFGTGLAAGIAMAIFLAPEAPEPAQPGWKAMVANYQSLYARASFDWSGTDPARSAAQITKVSEALDIDLSALPRPADMQFMYARILNFNGKPLAQLAYVRDDGTPVSLCILASSNPATDGVALETLQGMGAASWNTGRFAYLLIGGAEPQSLEPGAATFRNWSDAV